MFLQQVDIAGYASLKDVSVELSDLTVLVGPNNSGKSNIFNAIDFLSEVYRTNLTEAFRESSFSYFLTKTKTGAAREMRFKVLVNLPASPRRPGGSGLALRHSFTILPEKAARASST